MADSLLDARGYFWSASERVPEGKFRPANAAPGRLLVHASGQAELDLDQPLPTQGDVFGRMMRRGPLGECVAGILVGSAQRVLLDDVIGNGGRLHTFGPSTEALLAHRCLVFSSEAQVEKPPRFHSLELPLEGYEDWLGRPNISMRRTSRTTTASYPKQKTRRWRLNAATLELTRHLSGNYSERTGHVSWREKAALRLRFRAGMTLDQAAETAIRVQDLLMLLTDTNRTLEFPILRGRRSSARFYFTRAPGDETPAEWHRAWVPYPLCEGELGTLLEKWLAEYERLGPSMHLYLGNRRGYAMYAEHRFASLVWGLESLHRIVSTPQPNPRLQAKVERILENIKLSKDRAWAERLLRAENEPALSMRLSQLFAPLPLDFDPAELDAFSSRCAQRRNDISHFGGAREPGSYEPFVEDIRRLSSALDLLYHALLLQRAGVTDSVIRRYFMDGPSAYEAGEKLWAAGLTSLRHPSAIAPEHPGR